MSANGEQEQGVALCTCMRPTLSNEDDFCRACHGYIVAERADALRRAAVRTAEQRGREFDREREPRSIVVADEPGPRRVLTIDGGKAGMVAAIAAAMSKPETPTLVHDLDCTATHHNGTGTPTPGCKACDYAARRIVRAGLGDTAPVEGETPPRRDIRRVKSARELHEVADMAEQGRPLMGTRAYEMIQAAERAGDFEKSAEIRASVVAWAPSVRAAAIEKEKEDAREQTSTIRDAVGDLSALDRAKQKRERRKARNRAADANMRRGARDGGR